MNRKLDSLYRRTQQSASWEDLKRDDLGEYLDRCERVARAVLDAAGVSAKPGSHDPRPEIDRALSILWHVKTLRWQIENGPARSVAIEAIRLAQHVERFNVDRAVLKTVDVGVRVIDGNPNRKPDYTLEVEQYMAEAQCSLTKAREAVAAHYGISERTLIRQSQRKMR